MVPFLNYISKKDNLIYLYLAVAISIAYFLLLRILFPVPSFYFDSYTYLQVARDRTAVSFRPTGYSELINFFKVFSTSDVALITAQFFINILANLFLFFTFNWFFASNNAFKIFSFLLLIANPLYLFYSNYILSDSFFSAFTVLWFTLLIWILYQPQWYLIIIQLVLMALLFRLRYNAVIYPIVTSIALILSNYKWWKKLVAAAANFALVLLLVLLTVIQTKYYTGTKTFSAFGGWQLANNALHVLAHESLDTSRISNKQTKELITLSQNYFDTSRGGFDGTGVTSDFMWNKNSPLKKYMVPFAVKTYKHSYMETWTALGPVYSNLGKTIILKKPFAYFRYFVVPNAYSYVVPELEAYKGYCSDADTLNSVATNYFGYKTNKVGSKHSTLYSIIFRPWKYLFPVLNVLFIILLLTHLFFKKNRGRQTLLNRLLICFTAFYLINFVFVVVLAPSVFRYHVFIVTLLFPVVLLLLQELFIAGKTDRGKEC